MSRFEALAAEMRQATDRTELTWIKSGFSSYTTQPKPGILEATVGRSHSTPVDGPRLPFWMLTLHSGSPAGEVSLRTDDPNHEVACLWQMAENAAAAGVERLIGLWLSELRS